MSPPAICWATPPSLLITWPAIAGDAELQALEVVDALDLLAEPAAHLGAGVAAAAGSRRCSPCRTRAGVRARRPTASTLPAGARWCRRAARCRSAKRRVLADVIGAGGVTHLDRAVLHGVEHLQARHDLAGSEDADVELVVRHLADVLGEGLAGAVDACRATWESLTANRHLSSGIDSAMAGAASVLADATPPAPSAAVRKNLRRCMVVSLPGLFVLPGSRFHPAESACPGRADLAKVQKQSRSSAMQNGAPNAQTKTAPVERAPGLPALAAVSGTPPR